MKRLSKNECRKLELEMLNIISEICEKNNLKYYMCGGTLLGAIRHKGFIPWDDDIDIMLFRSDYNKLIKILKNQTRYSWLSVLTSDVDGYYYTFAKAVDNRTVAKMDDNITEHGLWVDIFPFDNLPNSEIKRKIFIMRCYFYRSIVMAMTTDFDAKDSIKHKKTKKILNFFSKFINKKHFIKKYERVSQKYNNINSNYVASLFSPYKLKECFEKCWFDDRRKYNFEEFQFFGPKDYDKYLSQLYGNYMKLPPKEERRDHKIIAFKK